MQANALDRKFNAAKIIKFVIPTIIMMICLSCFTIVDGAFVSNYVGENALASINIAFPSLDFTFGIAYMIAMGASAVISRMLGAGDKHAARRFLSFVYILIGVLSVISALVGSLGADKILSILGCTDALYAHAKEYLVILSLFSPALFYQIAAQTFFISAGKPQLGMLATITGGVCNAFLDYIFIAHMGMGIRGAAIATGIGWSIPGLFGIAFLIFNRRGHLYFTRPKLRIKLLFASFVNGSSQFITHVSGSVMTLLFNLQMLKYAGESGVTAITAVQYMEFLFTAVFTGYSQGVMPIIAYKYGAENYTELRGVLKNSFVFIAAAAAAAVAVSLSCAGLATGVFINPSSPTYLLARNGLMIYAVAFISMGFNMLIISLFTALGSGKIAAFLSFSRIALIITALFLAPLAYGTSGIFAALPIAETIMLLPTMILLFKRSKKYNYFPLRRKLTD